MTETQKRVKKILLGVVLTAALTAPLSAQAWVFLEKPTGGDGAEQQYFISHLPQAVQSVGWVPVNTKEESDLYITSNIESTTDFGLNTITVELYNSETDEFIATNAMGYSIVEEMDEWNRYLIYELTANAPQYDHATPAGVRELTLGERLWGQKEKRYWLHVGLRGGGDLRFYSPMTQANTESYTFDAGVQLMFQAFPFLGIQAEALYTMDNAPYFSVTEGAINANEEKTQASSLMIPLVLMITFRPDDWLIAPFGGAYFNVALGKMKTPGGNSTYKWNAPGIGWTAGIEVGRKVGPGTLFTDIRYICDLGDMISQDLLVKNLRTGVSVSLGYEFALIRKKVKGAKE